MKITLVSDVHLEYNTHVDLEFPEADVLICAGDIGDPHMYSYKAFLKKMTLLFDTVIVISGNHEYYEASQAQALNCCKSIRCKEQQIRRVCKDVGAIFLQKDFVDIGDVRILGCTLWADPFASKGERYWQDRYDAKHISSLKSAKDYARLHRNHKKWLEKMLKSAPSDKQIVVVTHHLPSYELIETKFKDSPKNGYYASHCDNLIPYAKLWLAGHTHRFIDESLYGVRCCCNPVGYPWETTPYDKDLHISL